MTRQFQKHMWILSLGLMKETGTYITKIHLSTFLQVLPTGHILLHPDPGGGQILGGKDTQL